MDTSAWMKAEQEDREGYEDSLVNKLEQALSGDKEAGRALWLRLQAKRRNPEHIKIMHDWIGSMG